MITPIGVEVFKGFRNKYPEFEVITPQRKLSYTVRTLTVAEEEILKGSVLTPMTVPQHLSEVLWKCIVKKPDDVKTFEDFTSKTTLRDRDALLYGLYVATYKDIQNFSVTCSQCEKTNKIKIDMQKAFSFNVWPEDEDCLNKRIKVPLEVTQGVNCYIKVPTVQGEIDVSKRSMRMSEQMATLATDLLMIDHFEVEGEIVETKDAEGKVHKKKSDPEVIKERDNILQAYNSLPAVDRKVINKTYLDTFDKCKIKVEVECVCPHCGNSQTVGVDVTKQFFLSLYE